jgi:O-acetyl-ADP-ribose deacetylase (regulator of RNase III)
MASEPVWEPDPRYPSWALGPEGDQKPGAKNAPSGSLPSAFDIEHINATQEREWTNIQNVLRNGHVGYWFPHVFLFLPIPPADEGYPRYRFRNFDDVATFLGHPLIRERMKWVLETCTEKRLSVIDSLEKFAWNAVQFHRSLTALALMSPPGSPFHVTLTAFFGRPRTNLEDVAHQPTVAMWKEQHPGAQTSLAGVIERVIVRALDLPTWAVEGRRSSAWVRGEEPRDDAANARLSVFAGEITDLECDAIVGPADGEVAATIKQLAGGAMSEEYERVAAGASAGSAVVTSGYALPAKCVIHAVGPLKDDRTLQEGYNSVLQQAANLRCRTFAICPISESASNEEFRSWAILTHLLRKLLTTPGVIERVVIVYAWRRGHALFVHLHRRFPIPSEYALTKEREESKAQPSAVTHELPPARDQVSASGGKPDVSHQPKPSEVPPPSVGFRMFLPTPPAAVLAPAPAAAIAASPARRSSPKPLSAALPKTAGVNEAKPKVRQNAGVSGAKFGGRQPARRDEPDDAEERPDRSRLVPASGRPQTVVVEPAVIQPRRSPSFGDSLPPSRNDSPPPPPSDSDAPEQPRSDEGEKAKPLWRRADFTFAGLRPAAAPRRVSTKRVSGRGTATAEFARVGPLRFVTITAGNPQVRLRAPQPTSAAGFWQDFGVVPDVVVEDEEEPPRLTPVEVVIGLRKVRVNWIDLQPSALVIEDTIRIPHWHIQTAALLRAGETAFALLSAVVNGKFVRVIIRGGDAVISGGRVREVDGLERFCANLPIEEIRRGELVGSFRCRVGRPGGTLAAAIATAEYVAVLTTTPKIVWVEALEAIDIRQSVRTGDWTADFRGKRQLRLCGIDASAKDMLRHLLPGGGIVRR